MLGYFGIKMLALSPCGQLSHLIQTSLGSSKMRCTVSAAR
jgi:hypothetical protein